jgi:hypothetical protein
MKPTSATVVGALALISGAILVANLFRKEGNVLPNQGGPQLVQIRWESIFHNEPIPGESADGSDPAEMHNLEIMRQYQRRVERALESGQPISPSFHASPPELLMEKQD